MQRILNTHTKTVHKLRGEKTSGTSVCGSLKHVPQARTRVVSVEDIQSSGAINQCGNCFEDIGGY